MSRIFNEVEIKKLKQVVSEGVRITGETDTLKEGMKDTVKAIAEELDIKPSVINKVIKIVHKNSLSEHQDEQEELDGLLEAVGQTN